uniref:Cystatin domain-containing protein n=1 Tax=Cyprinus carpio TaxID=7962 RepID=A0A8C2JKD3_CYPCA
MSAGIPGGIVDADINDEDVQKALQFAVAHYNRQSNDPFVRKVSKVIKVQQQVSPPNVYLVCNRLNWERH